MHLDAERAADIPGDYANIAFGDIQMARKNILHHVRRLRGLMHRQRIFGGVVIGEQRAAFERDAGVATEVVGFFDNQISLGESGIYAVGRQFAAEADVVAEFRMNYLRACERRFHVGNGGQRLPFAFNLFQRVFGLGARLRDDGGNRFALPAGAINGYRVLRGRLDAFQVAKHRDPRLAEFCERYTINRRDNAGHRARLRKIKFDNARVRMRAAKKHHMHESCNTQIIGVSAAPLQQTPGVGARDALPDVIGKSGRVHALLLRAISVVSTASTMA